jgi:hypothetical protein
VGDHERGLPGLQTNAAHFILQRAAGQRVERREWLIHQHDFRRDRERAGNADALLHAAGELRRTLVLGAGQAHQIDEGLRMRLDPGAVPIPPFRCHGIRDVAEHGAPRQQRMALKDHRAVKAGAFDRLPVDDDRAIARLVEARQNVQHRGLAAAGVPDHAAELAARHRQPEIFEHRDRAAIGARIAFCNPLDGNELVGHCTNIRVPRAVRHAVVHRRCGIHLALGPGSAQRHFAPQCARDTRITAVTISHHSGNVTMRVKRARI